MAEDTPTPPPPPQQLPATTPPIKKETKRKAAEMTPNPGHPASFLKNTPKWIDKSKYPPGYMVGPDGLPIGSNPRQSPNVTSNGQLRREVAHANLRRNDGQMIGQPNGNATHHVIGRPSSNSNVRRPLPQYSTNGPSQNQQVALGYETVTHLGMSDRSISTRPQRTIFPEEPPPFRPQMCGFSTGDMPAGPQMGMLPTGHTPTRPQMAVFSSRGTRTQPLVASFRQNGRGLQYNAPSFKQPHPIPRAFNPTPTPAQHRYSHPIGLHPPRGSTPFEMGNRPSMHLSPNQTMGPIFPAIETHTPLRSPVALPADGRMTQTTTNGANMSMFPDSPRPQLAQHNTSTFQVPETRAATPSPVTTAPLQSPPIVSSASQAVETPASLGSPVAIANSEQTSQLTQDGTNMSNRQNPPHQHPAQTTVPSIAPESRAPTPATDTEATPQPNHTLGSHSQAVGVYAAVHAPINASIHAAVELDVEAAVRTLGEAHIRPGTVQSTPGGIRIPSFREPPNSQRDQVFRARDALGTPYPTPPTAFTSQHPAIPLSAIPIASPFFQTGQRINASSLASLPLTSAPGILHEDEETNRLARGAAAQLNAFRVKNGAQQLSAHHPLPSIERTQRPAPNIYNADSDSDAETEIAFPLSPRPTPAPIPQAIAAQSHSAAGNGAEIRDLQRWWGYAQRGHTVPGMNIESMNGLFAEFARYPTFEAYVAARWRRRDDRGYVMYEPMGQAMLPEADVRRRQGSPMPQPWFVKKKK